jgi:outer membrane protein assembly factor BamB
MRVCRFSGVLGLLATIAAVPAVAGDWLQFRGTAGNGLSPESQLPVVWSPETNVAWKQPIPGRGWSSPIVSEEKLYLTTAVPAEGSTEGDVALRVICLDAKTGSTLWDTEVFAQEGKTAPRIHGKNSHASPTPLLADGRLYVHFGHEGTACLGLDGHVLWRNRSLTYKPVHGNGGSPICVDDLLIYNADGGDTRFVVALDRASGSVRWKTERTWPTASRFSFSTPLLISVNGQKQVISSATDAVVAYDPADGKEIWRVRYTGYSVIPQPVFGNGLVYICTGYAFPALLAIRPDGHGDVTASHIAWKTKKGVPNTPTPLLVGTELYMVSDTGAVSCLDATTGKLHWQERIGGSYSASPLYAAGRIYFQSEEGVGTVIKAGTKFERLAKNELKERSLASYAVADGALFIRTEHNLYRVQAH